MRNTPPSVRGYAVAVVATAAVGALRLALAPALGDVAPVIPFVLPVILAGWVGGFRPAVLATALGALLGTYLFVPPYDSLRVATTAEAVALALFLVCGTGIALVCESLHESRRRLQSQNRRLILEADERESAQQALRRSEARLRESERAFRLAADTAPSMIWSADPQGVITWASERWLRYCGLSPEQNARDWARLVVHPDDHERCVTAWSQALATGCDYEIEVRNRRHDGA
ncbi:MAG TPA: DUF4118 domain-containing protein, partial [Thermoanaerobaculia bacterium]|nr:DUF4118 domain-containing protein [Thermoanaerobaculia bacterium]